MVRLDLSDELIEVEIVINLIELVFQMSVLPLVFVHNTGALEELDRTRIDISLVRPRRHSPQLAIFRLLILLAVS